MKMARVIGVVIDSKIAEKLSVIIATKLMCIPGVRPVRVPASNPRKIARVSSIIILLLLVTIT